MQWIARPDLAIGDHILTPFGVARVIEFDLARDGIVTTHGSWGFDELEAMPAPDTSDLEQVEAWLGVAARIIPKSQIESTSSACECGCEHCYRVDQRRGSVQINSSHFRNNEVCRCATPIRDPSSPGTWLPRCPCL